MELVEQWLQGIGLDANIVGTFEAAGITTPSAIAELDVSHFEALGVQNAEDRRKLFFLVQRIKKALAENQSMAAVDGAGGPAVLAPLKSLDEKAIPVMDTKRETKENRHSHLNRNRSADDAASTITQQQESQQENDLEDAELDNLLRNSSDDSSSESRDHLEMSEGEQITGDASSNEAVSAAVRKSKRLQQQAGSTAPLVAAKGRTSSTGHRRSLGVKASAVTASKSQLAISHKSSSGASPSVSSGSSTDSSSRPRRTSGMSGPNRAGESRLQQPSSMRTGKKLSAIPSNKVAPSSPLVDLPKTSRLIHNDDAEVEDDEEDDLSERLVSRGRRRSSSFGDRSRGSSTGSATRSGNMSDVSNHSSSNHRRRSLSDHRPPRHMSQNTNRNSVAQPSRNSTGRQSLGSQSGMKESIRRPRRSLGGRSQSDMTTNRTTPAKSSVVTIQGGKDDDSFKAQIKQLRDDTNAEYELFGKPREEDICDMRIRVVIRKRPMSKSEVAAAGDVDVIHPLDYGSHGKILVYQPKTRVNLTKEVDTLHFAFDNVFDENSTNRQLYEQCVRHLIPTLFEDEQSVSLFAYGQTGSGKTFTMLGSSPTGLNMEGSSDCYDDLGIYYMASLDIFHLIKNSEYGAYSVSLSLFEIYGGKLFDLLNDRVCVKCLEDQHGKVNFPGLSEHEVPGPDYLLKLINLGATNRSTGSTSRNADSSRSHAIMQIHIMKPAGRGRKIEHSRLTIVDLAGSERGADTATASRATRLEGAEINTSLLTLKEVIRAMATGDAMTHVPFRGSKLTQVLKESFVGENCKSVMIGCISPNIGNCEQTLNTLRYADRVKERNSVTGEYAGRDLPSARPAKTRPLPDLTVAIKSQPSLIENGDADDISETLSQDDSSASAVLDDLLSPTPVKEPLARRAKDDDSSNDDAAEAAGSSVVTVRDAANQLMQCHKASMTKLLEMLKDEMEVVNQVDGDDDGFEEYVTRIKELHEQQLSYIVTMREQLILYHAARNSISIEGSPSDDSFEDLRD